MKVYYHGTTKARAENILAIGMRPSDVPNVTKSQRFAAYWGNYILKIVVPEGYIQETFDEGEQIVLRHIPPKYIRLLRINKYRVIPRYREKWEENE